MAFFKNYKRKFSLHSRRDGVSARTVYRTGGQAIPFDSISSSDGLPSGSKTRSEIEQQKKWEFTGRRLKMIKGKILAHPITVLWCIILPTIGAFFEGLR